MSNKRDYYDVLQVSKNASEKEIKTAYRKLAMKYHPDKLKDGTSDNKMKELNEAYEVLSDSTKRKQYDNFGHSGVNGGAGSGNPFEGFTGAGGFSEFFQDIFDFGGNFRQRNRTTSVRGDDYQTTKVVSFLDSVLGINFKEKMNKFDICLHCGGTGAQSSSDLERCTDCKGEGQKRVSRRTIFGEAVSLEECRRCEGIGKTIKNKCKNCRGEKYIKETKEVNIPIPPGTATGAVLKLSGYGGPGVNGGSSGDLYIKIIVKEHPFYNRQGNDIYLDFPVSFMDIIQEKTVEIPTPYGSEKIRLKKNYRDSMIVNLAGKGIKTSKSIGNLKLKLRIIIPDLDKRDLKNLTSIFEKINDKSNEQFNREVNRSK